MAQLALNGVRRTFLGSCLLAILVVLSFSCSRRNEEEVTFPLLEQREKALGESREWTSFLEAWDRQKRFPLLGRKDKGGLWKERAAEREVLRRICLEKANELRGLVERGILSETELEVIIGSVPRGGIRSVETEINVVDVVGESGTYDYDLAEKAHFQENVYDGLIMALPTLRKLAGQAGCVAWVRENYTEVLRESLKTMDNISEKSLLYWSQTVSMQDVRKNRNEMNRVFEKLP